MHPNNMDNIIMTIIMIMIRITIMIITIDLRCSGLTWSLRPSWHTLAWQLG